MKDSLSLIGLAKLKAREMLFIKFSCGAAYLCSDGFITPSRRSLLSTGPVINSHNYCIFSGGKSNLIMVCAENFPAHGEVLIKLKSEP
jgi:hypothetical protein